MGSDVVDIVVMAFFVADRVVDATKHTDETGSLRGLGRGFTDCGQTVVVVGRRRSAVAVAMRNWSNGFSCRRLMTKQMTLMKLVLSMRVVDDVTLVTVMMRLLLLLLLLPMLDFVRVLGLRRRVMVLM